MPAEEYNQPIVIDNGSGLIKAGFAGEQIPKCRFRSCIGRPKYERVRSDGLDGSSFIGSRCQEHRGILALNYPIEHGIVNNWDDMEKIWKYIYAQDQLNSETQQHPVLLTEAPNNPFRNREKAAEIMFEHLTVPALFVSIQAVLALYACGKTTGVVLDSGDGVTHSVPVYEGYALNKCVNRIDIAGRDITRYLNLCLQKEGYNFTTSAEMETVRTIKERCCFLTPDLKKSISTATRAYIDRKKEVDITFASGDAKSNNKKSKNSDLLDKNSSNDKNSSSNDKNGDTNYDVKQPRIYKLPDGKKISIYQARFLAPEILFKPELIGEEVPGVHEMLYNSIQKSDLDIRSVLYENIFLSGGTTLFKGFGDRLFSEMKDCIGNQEVKLRINANGERIFSTWLGGSILASLDTFRKMWISKEEYEEKGVKRLYVENML